MNAHKLGFGILVTAGMLLFSPACAAAKLVGFASLPANSIMPGPDSGQFIEAQENLTLPFNGQPAQGFSALIADGQGAYLALSDNGFGSRENSADFLLRVYILDPDFRTSEGGLGNIFINGYVNLSDPGRRMPYRITADHECIPGPDSCIDVERRVRRDRLLTGADLDPESFQPSSEGGFWIGDEFGPFLLHFSNDGILLEPPYDLAGLVSPGRPGSRRDEANLARSRGFEGLARGVYGARLFPMLEGVISGDQDTLNIFTFDIDGRAYTNASPFEPSYRYELEEGARAIGAFKLFSDAAGLIIERDSGEGAKAQHKKIYRVQLDDADERGRLRKREWVDLLNIDDPDDLNRDGNQQFSLPMATIESIVISDRNHLVVLTDNNYPFGSARGTRPEASEMILIEVDDLW